MKFLIILPAYHRGGPRNVLDGDSSLWQMVNGPRGATCVVMHCAPSDARWGKMGHWHAVYHATCSGGYGDTLCRLVICELWSKLCFRAVFVAAQWIENSSSHRNM